MIQGLVSIIVPVYNSEKYLDQCVSSIVEQTYSSLEIILVDDGSTDNSPRMCDDWAQKDNRVKVVHKQNAGAGLARNSGLDIAAGEFVCFFDSDDYLDPDAIYKAMTLAQKEKTDIVIFGAVTVDQNGNYISRMVPEAKQVCYCGEEIQNVFLPDLIDRKNDHVKIRNLIFSFWVCMFSMELIRKNEWKIVSEREYLSEDSYSLLLLYKNVKSVAILQEPLYFYREIQGSLSRAYKENFYSQIKKFYLDCIGLAVRLEYSEEVRRRISGLFLALSIGTMKQIASAAIGTAEQIRGISRIVKDEMMQSALLELIRCYKALPRRILVGAMRRKLCFVVYLLIKIQAVRK